MTTPKKIDLLHQILFDHENTGNTHQTIHELHEIYAVASGISAGSLIDKDIHLSSGKAISPIGAAHCLLEIKRTTQFLRGIRQAVLQLQQKFKGQQITILYAGCGPYATLVTPLTSMFSDLEIKFDLLDVNEISLAAVKQMYQRLGLLHYINKVIKADATLHEIAKAERPHLIISETMNAALKNEPQVQIMLNLIPQLREGGFFIPQEIAVDAYLLDLAKEQAGFFVGGKPAKRLRLGNVYTIAQSNCNPPQATLIQIPKEIDGRNQLSLLTKITVFGKEELGIYDCSLTLPQKVIKLEPNLMGMKVSFRYVDGEKPHFEHALI